MKTSESYVNGYWSGEADRKAGDKAVPDPAKVFVAVFGPAWAAVVCDGEWNPEEYNRGYADGYQANPANLA